MWSAVASLLLAAIKWIFGGKQQSEGVAQGHAEQLATDQQQELKNVEKADNARNAVSDDPASIVRDPDNAGPA